MLTPLRPRGSFLSILRGAALALAVVAVGAGCTDDSDPEDGVGEGGRCGGLTAATCADGLFCDYPDGFNCGITDGSGTCQPRPTVCVPVIDEVCGCDGEPYSSPCDAQRAGTDVSSDESC
jgi:hypothetical protein